MGDFAQTGGLSLNECVGTNNGQGVGVGTLITSSATQYAKGSYYQITAATSFDASMLLVFIGRHDAGPTRMVDIAIGPPGSEQIIAANLFTRGQSATEELARYLLPIRVPAGSRISARMASNTTGAQTTYVTINLFGSGFNQSQAFSGVELISTASLSGIEVANQILNGAAGVYTAWLGHNTATPRDYKAISIWLSGYCPGGVMQHCLIDFATGPAGSEQPFLTGIPFVSDPTSAGKSENIGPLQIPIAAGSRVSSRVLFHAVGNTANYCICGIYGLY